MKTLKTLCLPALLTAMVLLSASFTAGAQTRTITLKADRQPISAVLKSIEQLSGYTFFYNDATFDKNRLVSVNATNKDVLAIVGEVFKDTDITASFLDKNIVLSRKPKTQTPQAQAVQPAPLEGKVLDSDGLPLPGASVFIKGTKTGTVTDNSGAFSIPAKEGDVLTVAFLGFRDSEVTVGKSATISIALEPDTQFLDEVVVVGYDTQKKVNLTGSVASVSTDDFSRKPISQVSAALQGMAPGVTVTAGGGAPGVENVNIQIRGIGSFGGSNSNPLVLIDGVEGSLGVLDATQIEKISILKDAASSSIYGNRAANGVILVTTKRGSKGHSSVTYRGYAGWQKPTVYPSVATPLEYMKLSQRAALNDGSPTIYTDEYIENYYKNHYLDPDAFPITDWQERILKGDGFTHNHVLTLTAGNDKVRTMTSLGYLSQDAIVKFSDYQRMTFRNNMDVSINDRLELKVDVSAVLTNRHKGIAQDSALNFMNAKDPLSLAQWSDGSYAAFTGGTKNPLPMIEQNVGGGIQRKSLRLTSALSLVYKPAKWLTLEAKAAPRLSIVRAHDFYDMIYYHSDPYGTVSPTPNREYNYLKETDTYNYNGLYQFTAIASKSFGNHNLRFLAGASYEDADEQTLSATRRDYDYPQYEVINAGADNIFKDNSGNHTQLALASFFGRLNYNYRERYLLEANIRVDGSSRFLSSNRWGVFPSVSGAWRVTEEPFMASIKNTLTELKFRASYGTLGNQNIGSDYPTVQLLTLSSYAAAEQVYPIVTQTNLANTALSWETTRMADVGIDAALWNKFTVTADYYYKLTDGILMKLDIPSTIGLSAPYQNAGVVSNRGWELGLGYHDSWGPWSLGVNANLSDVINKIEDMKGTYSSSGVIRNQEGYSINSLYMLKCLGIVQSQEQADYINDTCPQYSQITHPGDLYYEDIAGALDENGKPIPDGKIDDNDRQILGCLIPRYTYGLVLDLGWKGLNLNVQFQGVGKADAYISGGFTQPCVSGNTFRSEHMDNWTPENPGAKFPRLSYTSDLNKKVSTFWMADASYLRLKNLQLSWTLPKKALSAMKIKNLTLFANATNLFSLDNYYQGYDPETAYQSGSQGATTGSIGDVYPLVSTYTFGVEVKF